MDQFKRWIEKGKSDPLPEYYGSGKHGIIFFLRAKLLYERFWPSFPPHCIKFFVCFISIKRTGRLSNFVCKLKNFSIAKMFTFKRFQ